MNTLNASWKKRVGTLLVGLTANFVLVMFFDNFLYPKVIGNYGFLFGAHIMLWASILNCFLTLKFYDWSEKDWLGIETIKEVRELGDSRLGILISSFFKKNQLVQLVVLSIWQDPFIAMVFLREGAHRYGVMTKKDWKNFFVSIIIANTFWATFCWSGIKILEAMGIALSSAINIFCSLLFLVTITCLVIGKVMKKRKNKSKI